MTKILNCIQELQEKGVQVRTLDGQADTTASKNPLHKAMKQLLGVFVELKHSIIVDRLQTGWSVLGEKEVRLSL